MCGEDEFGTDCGKKDIGFLKSDIIGRTGGNLIVPLHVARDIICLLKSLGASGEYYAALLLDGFSNGERRAEG